MKTFSKNKLKSYWLNRMLLCIAFCLYAFNGYSQDQSAQLFEALSYEIDLPKLEQVLEAGVDVNVVDENNRTPLFMAVYNTSSKPEVRLKAVQLLLEHGANVNEPSGPRKAPALLYVARKGHTKEGKLLIKHGAEVNIADQHGWNALTHAAAGGHLEMVKVLVANGALLEDSNALVRAASSNKLEVAEFLMNKDMPVNPPSPRMSFPLYEAARRGHLELVNLLLKNGADVNLTIDNVRSKEAEWKIGHTALAVAVAYGHEQIVEVLLEKGADPNVVAEFDDEQSLLHHAVTSRKTGHEKMAMMLMEHGADVNTRTPKTDDSRLYNYTPLMSAASLKKINMVKALIAHGAKVDLQSEPWKETALQNAVRSNCLECVQVILDAGADPDLATNSGNTPLMMAANHGRLKIVNLLLDHDAKVTLRNDKGQTPLDVARMRKRSEEKERYEKVVYRLEEVTPKTYGGGHRKSLNEVLVSEEIIQKWKGGRELFGYFTVLNYQNHLVYFKSIEGQQNLGTYDYQKREWVFEKEAFDPSDIDVQQLLKELGLE